MLHLADRVTSYERALSLIVRPARFAQLLEADRSSVSWSRTRPPSWAPWAYLQRCDICERRIGGRRHRDVEWHHRVVDMPP